MQTVYTNYWINKRHGVRKEHGSYKSESEAIAGIEAWWELQQDKYKEVSHKRTNTGALEITYGDDNYYYRIEKRKIDHQLPERRPIKRPKGEIERLRKQHNLNDESFLFEELAEPYQDRLMTAMNDGQKLLTYSYDYRGRPINKLP